MHADCFLVWSSCQLSQSPPAVWHGTAVGIRELQWGLSILLSFRSLVSHHQFQSIKRVVSPNPKSAKCFYVFLSGVFTDKCSTGWKHTASQYSAKWLALFFFFFPHCLNNYSLPLSLIWCFFNQYSCSGKMFWTLLLCLYFSISMKKHQQEWG